MSVDLDARLSEWREQIDKTLGDIIRLSAYPSDFKKILEYAVFPGGKRLRPILFLEWHSVFAPPTEAALTFACAIELMHCFSLIHDDMPCIDNDEMRRGKPTVHKAFGEGKALLAGDALLDMAYNEMINACIASENVNPLFFFKLNGDNGIIHGQYLDLYADIKDLDGLLSMYKRKTGALIEAACTVGYMFSQKVDANEFFAPVAWQDGNAPIIGPTDGLSAEQRMRAARIGGAMRFGELFGTAFQIYDDVSEYIAGEPSDGTTVMDYLNLDEAKKLLNKYLDEAIATLGIGYDGDTSYLRAFADKFVIM